MSAVSLSITVTDMAWFRLFLFRLGELGKQMLEDDCSHAQELLDIVERSSHVDLAQDRAEA